MLGRMKAPRFMLMGVDADGTRFAFDTAAELGSPSQGEPFALAPIAAVALPVQPAREE